MLEKMRPGSGRLQPTAANGDARAAALQLMSEALARLDSDNDIPAIIGAHLQSAIDALWMSLGDQRSIQLH
jgi:hypothetical protein